MYDAKILADSISPAGHRLTTFEVTFPRIVLAEFNTHRVFARNSASSRAIPVEKMLKRVQEDPFSPVYWGKNQKGMQADQELTPEEQFQARERWFDAADGCVEAVKALVEQGVHKQITNRLLEPFLWHTVIVTATEWGNFFNLRDNGKAQPEIHKAAGMMHELFKASSPAQRVHDWHLPLVQFEEMRVSPEAPWVPISAGRCARVSYLTHDGKRDLVEDVRLHDSLLESGHMSPLEHPARPMTPDELAMFASPVRQWNGTKWMGTGEITHFLGPFNGWVQLRKLVPGEADVHTYRGTQV